MTVDEPVTAARASTRRPPKPIELDLPPTRTEHGLATRTVEQVIGVELREWIARGHLAPADRLPLRQLAKHFGVSTTPVRTALVELAAEGLVESRSHSGFRVSEISLEEFEEVWTARVGLEWWLTRRAVERITGEDVERLDGLLENLLAAAKSRATWPEYVERTWIYRRALYSRAARPRMLAALDLAYIRSARYSRMMLASTERVIMAAERMERVHQAVRAGDALQAQQLIREGMEWTMEAALKQFGPMLVGQDEPVVLPSHEVSRFEL